MGLTVRLRLRRFAADIEWGRLGTGVENLTDAAASQADEGNQSPAWNTDAEQRPEYFSTVAIAQQDLFKDFGQWKYIQQVFQTGPASGDLVGRQTLQPELANSDRASHHCGERHEAPVDADSCRARVVQCSDKGQQTEADHHDPLRDTEDTWLKPQHVLEKEGHGHQQDTTDKENPVDDPGRR